LERRLLEWDQQLLFRIKISSSLSIEKQARSYGEASISCKWPTNSLPICMTLVKESRCQFITVQESIILSLFHHLSAHKSLKLLELGIILELVVKIV
jgi:hypothetical protein